MTRAQQLAVTHGLTNYAAGLVTDGVAETVNGDVLHLTGAPVPVNSDAFEYAVFDSNASTQLVNLNKSANDPYGTKLTFGGTTTTGLLEGKGGHTDWFPVAGQTDAQVLNSVRSAARLAATRLHASRLNEFFTNLNANGTSPSAIDLTSTATESVELLQEQIDLALLAAGGYGKVHLLWGVSAFRKFVNHTKVQGRVNGGAKRTDPSTLTYAQIDDLLGMNTVSRPCRAVYNSANDGQTVSNAFMLAATVYIAVVSPMPLTTDPSGIKLFQGPGDPLTPTFYKSNNGTHEAVSWDWREVIKVTNAGAIRKQAFTV